MLPRLTPTGACSEFAGTTIGLGAIATPLTTTSTNEDPLAGALPEAMSHGVSKLNAIVPTDVPCAATIPVGMVGDTLSVPSGDFMTKVNGVLTALTSFRTATSRKTPLPANKLLLVRVVPDIDHPAARALPVT